MIARTTTLPSDAWQASAKRIAPELTGIGIEQLARFRDRILHTNAQFNLTAIRDPEEIDNRLLLESLRLAALVREFAESHSRPVRAVDMGTGAGIPGIPLAILFPDIEFALVDATAKKVRFVDETIESLGLTNARAVHGRVEELAREPHWRETRDLVLARAVGSLATLLELSMPLLEVGGRAIFPKGALEPAEIRGAKKAANLLGAEIVDIVQLDPLDGCPVTHVALADKMTLVIDRYPRRSGLPAREPLGG
ncbi:MAG: 16S rRNA (guanine(527)-N(7))-methyltransferase RsmG [Thermomicrobiales bacterium]|nr:16S rRNA (guanine(527)-N(7))-methyltransferase RsmG [Thermomicrobiales bacterium]